VKFEVGLSASLLRKRGKNLEFKTDEFLNVQIFKNTTNLACITSAALSLPAF
jgi:hypothetical protein